MRLTIKQRTTEKNAGKKQEVKELSKQSYLYDTCDKCPLWVYIELVCNDNISVLVINGDHTDNELIEAKRKLMMEFSEISGNEQSTIISNTLKNIYLYRSEIQVLSMCIRLIYAHKYDEAIKLLKEYNINVSIPDNEQEFMKLMKIIEGKSKMKLLKLKEAKRKYESLYNSEESKEITPVYYDKQLVMLSKHVGFKLDKNIFLSEYAAYLNDFKNYLKITQNGKF